MTSDIAAIAQDWDAYLRAVDVELAVCPHCETWFLSECINGRGCPTPDGRNGETIRAHLMENPE